MFCIQKSSFTCCVDNIYYLDSMETDAIQMYNSVVVQGIGEFSVLYL